MQQPHNLQGPTYGGFPSQVNGGNQDPVCFCSKHNQEITSFCMKTLETLCVICKAELEQLSTHDQNGNQNLPSQGHNILPIGEAIENYRHDMQTKLAGLAKFIETKRTIDLHFPDQGTLQSFRQQNQFFDDAYSEAHRLFTDFQNMAVVYKTQNLQNYIVQFHNAYLRLQDARTKMEPIVNQAQQQQPANMRGSGAFGYENSPINNNPHAQPSMMANQPFYGQPQNPYQQQQNVNPGHDFQNNQAQPSRDPFYGQNIPGQAIPSHNQQQAYSAGQQPGFQAGVSGNAQSSAQYDRNQAYKQQQSNQATTTSANHLQSETPAARPVSQAANGIAKQPSASSEFLQQNQANYQRQAPTGNGQHTAQQQHQNGRAPNSSENQNAQNPPAQRAQPATSSATYRGLSLKILIELEETTNTNQIGGGPQQIKTLEMQIMPPMNESIRQLQKLVICEELKKYGQINDYSQIQNMHVYLIEETERPDGGSTAGQPPMHYTRLDQLLEHSIETLNLRNTPSLLFTHRKLNVPSYQPHDPRRQQVGDQKPANGQAGIKPGNGQGIFGGGVKPINKLPGQHQMMSKPNMTGGKPNMNPMLGNNSIVKQNSVRSNDIRPKVPLNKGAKPTTQINGKDKTNRERKNRVVKPPQTVDVFYRMYQPPVSNDSEADEEQKEPREDDQQEDENEINTRPQDSNQIAAPKNNEPFNSHVSLTLKSRLRDLKKSVLDQLNMGTLCNLRVYFSESFESQDDDEAKKNAEKDENAEKEGQMYVGEELIGPMSTLSECGLKNGGKVEVELLFGVSVVVAGRGGGYKQRVEVKPDEKLDVLRTRVNFFKLFSDRGYDVYLPEQDKILDAEALQTTTFQDSGLKDSSEVVLKESKKKVEHSGSEMEEQSVEGEEMEEEGYGESADEEMSDPGDEQEQVSGEMYQSGEEKDLGEAEAQEENASEAQKSGDAEPEEEDEEQKD